MKYTILIDSYNPDITIIACLYDKKVIDLFCETKDSTNTVGNIYLGKVINVTNSLAAYFVDYGFEKNGFIPFTSSPKNLKKDDFVIVQVLKNIKGSKGARLSGFVKLVGQHSVLMPYGSFGAKTDESIVKSKQNTSDYNLVKNELIQLENLWNKISSQKHDKPKLLYEECSLIEKILRDKYYDSEIEIIVEGKQQFIEVENILKKMSITHTLKEYHSEIPIFYKYNIIDEIKNVMNNQITLPCGGSIVIDTSEAMVSIDINSSSSSHSNLEGNSYKVNIEAAEEIAKQIRLRDLSGIIAIDFIDMQDQNNIIRVESTFRDFMKKDSPMIKIGRINEFGVLMLSRPRSNLNIQQYFYTKCNSCLGNGFMKSVENISSEILYEIRLSMHSVDSEIIRVECHERVCEYMLNDMRGVLYELEKNKRKIRIVINNALHNTFVINPRGFIKTTEIIVTDHPILEKKRVMRKLMQDLRLSKGFICHSNRESMFLIDMGGRDACFIS